MEELNQELRVLKAKAVLLEQEKDQETNPESKNVIRQELTALRNQIAALQSDITEQRRGNFLFFVVNFILH